MTAPTRSGFVGVVPALSLVAAIAASHSPANAQNNARVWPPGHDAVPAGAAMATPFGIDAGRRRPRTRSVTAYAGSTLPFGAGAQLREIAFRRDAVHRETYPAHTGNTLHVRIGSIDSARWASPKQWDLWRGEADLAFSGRLDLPAAAPPTGGRPAPFQLVIPFRTPWTYPGGDFAIDLVFEGRATAAAWRRDALFRPLRDASWLGLAPGCSGSNGMRPYAWFEADAATPGGELRLHLDRAALPPVGSAALAVFGAPLRDAIDLAPLGLPRGCSLQVAPRSVIPALVGDRSTRFARSLVTVPIPDAPALSGQAIAAQWLTGDFGLTARVPVAASNAVWLTIGAAARGVFYGRTFWSHGSRGLYEDSSGRVSRRVFVPVTRFRY